MQNFLANVGPGPDGFVVLSSSLRFGSVRFSSALFSSLLFSIPLLWCCVLAKRRNESMRCDTTTTRWPNCSHASAPRMMAANALRFLRIFFHFSITYKPPQTTLFPSSSFSSFPTHLLILFTLLRIVTVYHNLCNALDISLSVSLHILRRALVYSH